MEGLDRLKQATRWMWSLGDNSQVSPFLEVCAQKLSDACDIAPEMLDLGRVNRRQRQQVEEQAVHVARVLERACELEFGEVALRPHA